jgi:hypothetical protein
MQMFTILQERNYSGPSPIFQRLRFRWREILKITLKEIRYKLSHIKHNF